jgi:hypothetical protein
VLLHGAARARARRGVAPQAVPVPPVAIPAGVPTLPGAPAGALGAAAERTRLADHR